MKAKYFVAYWLECVIPFQDFKVGERYWLESLPNNEFNVRSDNLLGKTYTISDEQLATHFVQTKDKVQL